MAKIINLLDKAIEAKFVFETRLSARKMSGIRTNSIFICHLFENDRKEWQKVVEPFMDDQCGGYNNISNYVADVLGDWTNESRYQNVTETVRLKWLNDLIEAARKDGDDAKFPNLMSKQEIRLFHMENS